MEIEHFRQLPSDINIYDNFDVPEHFAINTYNTFHVSENFAIKIVDNFHVSVFTNKDL